ncbi:MAG TPA: shikimate dehydrogenase [Haloplasmataceae bacterium]
MKKYGLLGNKIEYSISPLIHNNHFALFNLDAIYEILDIDDLENNISLIRQYSGLNVTKPYKEKILKFCQVLNAEAKEIKAVNCLKIINDKLYGYNTDVYGFYMLLVKNQLINHKRQVLIIGAGGAAKAVYYALKTYTNHDVYITNRTSSKVNFISSNTIDFSLVNNFLTEFDIIINCTSILDLPIKIDKIKKDAVVIDINYQENNLFLQKAQTLNLKTVNGIDMLIYQAAKSFAVWFEKEANVEVMYDSIRKG